MWLAFKALPILAKLGIALAIVLSLLTVLGSAYYVGYTKGENISAVEISKYQGKVNELGKQLATAQGTVNDRILTKYVPQIQTVEHTRDVNHNVIVTQVVHQFNLSKGALYAINQSILGQPIDPILAHDTADSGIADTAAIDVISGNNADSLANSAQLTSLQEWIKEQNEAVEQIISGKSDSTSSVLDSKAAGPDGVQASDSTSSTDAASTTTTHNSN